MLIDPNANLTNKHYTDDDWQNVVSGSIVLGKDKTKIIAQWQLEVAWSPKKFTNLPQRGMEACQVGSVFNEHVPRAYAVSRGINNFTPAIKLAGHLAMFNRPCKITHRVNEKGLILFIVSSFGGREVKAS